MTGALAAPGPLAPFDREALESTSLRGALIGTTLILLWCATLVLFVSLGLETLGWPLALLALAFRTWLSTGLFITAHDAMHGVAAARWPRLNDALGRVSLMLYALFPFGALREKHHLHHAHAGREADPDFHDDEHPGALRWYLRFVGQYLRWWQLIGMAALFNVGVHLLGIPEVDLLLFWVAPALLSTVQLFFFGTWLPHRDNRSFRDGHRARSNEYPEWLSLLTCYHFGYHWEHHVSPWTPWWLLPHVRRELRDES